MATFTNYCHNPSVEVGDSGYAQIGTGSSRSRITTDAAPGAGSACMSFSIAGTAADQGFEFAGLTGLNLPAGTVIYVTPYIKSVSGGTAYKVAARLHYTDATNGFGSYVDADLTTGWTRHTAFHTVPVGKTLDKINFRVATRTVFGGAAVFRVDAVMFTVGPAPAYFDGSTPGATWTGTAHASFSTLTIGATRPASILTLGSSHVGPLRVGKG